jgi:hypothetical protein
MSSFRRQWLWPIILSLSTLLGLLAGLIGEGGIWWALCWLTLALPLVMIACHLTATR